MVIYLRDVKKIITMNSRRDILKDKTIVIDRENIVDLGEYKTVRRKWGRGLIIDCSSKVALPGLIDLHGHSTQAFMRGLFEDKPLPSWLAYMHKARELMDDDMRRLGVELTFLEKLLSGTTTTVDMERCADIVFDVAKKYGIRLIEAVVLVDSQELPYSGLKRISDLDSEVNFAKKIIKKYNNDMRRAIFGPLGFPASSFDLLKRVAEEARELKTLVQTHCAEWMVNPSLSAKIYGLRELEKLEEIGFLGPNVMLVHSVYLTDYEIMALAKYQSSVVYCPSSNAKLGNGIARIPEMLARGVPVGIGTDGAASNNSQDMFTEMKIASLIQKARLKDSTVMTAEKVLEMATIKAAEIIKMRDKIGSIEVGKKADIVLLDWRNPSKVPLENIVSHIVYNTSGAEVDTVIVNGKILLENRELKIPVNTDELYEKIEEKYHILIENLNQ